MKQSVLLAVGLFIFLPIPSVSAQSVGAYPAAERGMRSIVLGIAGGPQIGYWTRRSAKTDLGVDMGVSGFLGQGPRTLILTATPALKHYRTATGPLAPYSYFGIPLSAVFHEREDHFSVGGVAAFGLEWLPIPEVSVGGHVGIRASYVADGLEFSTLSSGIRVHLYF